MSLTDQFTEHGYTDLKEVPGRGICGIQKFMFTHGLAFGLNKYGYIGRYCYETYEEAQIALKYWNGEGDPLGNWIKYKGQGGDRLHPKLAIEDALKNNVDPSDPFIVEMQKRYRELQEKATRQKENLD